MPYMPLASAPHRSGDPLPAGYTARACTHEPVSQSPRPPLSLRHRRGQPAKQEGSPHLSHTRRPLAKRWDACSQI